MGRRPNNLAHLQSAHMVQQAERMQYLVEDFLTLSRLEIVDRPKSEELVPVAQARRASEECVFMLMGKVVEFPNWRDVRDATEDCRLY